MKVLISFYSKTGSTERVALVLREQLVGMGHSVELARILPKEDLKAYQYRKDGKDLELGQAVLDVGDFDLVLVGTPVWNFSPAPIVLSYLRMLKNAGGKPFALFVTCTALPGTTVQRMSSILTTSGARVLNNLTIRSVFEIDERRLNEARRFAVSIAKLF